MPAVSGTLPPGTKFAVESVKNGTKQDLKMRMEVPKHYGWGAVGIGNQMDGATIFLTYPSKNGNGSTLSVRKGLGTFEPEPYPMQFCHIQGTSSSTGSFIETAFVCPGLGDDPRLKGNSKSSWIWSAGPGLTVDSNLVNANIDKHHQKGTFTVDMVKAAQVPSSGPGAGVPSISGGGGITSTVTTLPPHPLILAHASMLAGSFLILFPLGIFLLRIRSVRLHWITQTLAFLLSVVGFIIGIYMSASTTEFSSFTEHHQIVGIVTVSLLFPQIAMGCLNHWRFKSTGKSTVLRWPHTILGRGVIILGMVNGVLGFLLYDNTKGAIGYGVAIGIVLLSLFALTVWSLTRRSKEKKGRSEISAAGAEAKESGY